VPKTFSPLKIRKLLDNVTRINAYAGQKRTPSGTEVTAIDTITYVVLQDNIAQNGSSKFPQTDRRAAQIAAKDYLLRKLAKPRGKLQHTHLRYRLLTALHGFKHYQEVALSNIQRKRDLYGNVSRGEKSVRFSLALFLVSSKLTFRRSK